MLKDVFRFDINIKMIVCFGMTISQLYLKNQIAKNSQTKVFLKMLVN